MPEPSNDDRTKSSASSGDSQRNEENYHVDTGKIPRKKRKVGVVQRSTSHKKDLRNEKPSHSTKHVIPSLLEDELDEDKSPMEIGKKNPATSQIHLSSNDTPPQWNLGKLYQSQVWLKIILYCKEMI